MKKGQILTILLVIALAIGIFTPLGSRVKAFAGNLISTTNAPLLERGTKLPSNSYEWQLLDDTGIPFELETQKGKVIFLNFWATWCGPCIAELPSIQKLYEDYGDRVAFILVTKESIGKAQSFMERKNYDLPVYFRRTKGPPVFDSKIIPTTYIIDRNAVIKASKRGEADWNSNKIRALLDELLLKE